jgi:inorganic pyrophosphatase
MRKASTTRSWRSASAIQLSAIYSSHDQLPVHLLREMRRFFEDYKVLERKQVLVEDLLGTDDALRIIREALDLYRKLRRGELKSAHA